ncbi:unnamed protein product [Boreogadus saida]
MKAEGRSPAGDADGFRAGRDASAPSASAHLIAPLCPPPRFDVRKEKRRINWGLGHLSRTHQAWVTPQSTKTFGTQTCCLPTPSRSPTPPSVSLHEAGVQGAVLEELSLRFA